MTRYITQPGAAPTRKLAAAGIGGGIALPIAQLIVAGLRGLGVDIDPETAAALATIITWVGAMASGYLTRERVQG